MWGFVLQASGITIIMACGSERPESSSSSMALSIMAESLPPGVMMGKSFLMSSPNSGERSTDSRACIQLMLPLSVLISPLCAM